MKFCLAFVCLVALVVFESTSANPIEENEQDMPVMRFRRSQGLGQVCVNGQGNCRHGLYCVDDCKLQNGQSVCRCGYCKNPAGC